MGFVHPELLLLAIPAAVVGWKLRGGELGTQIVRALVLAALVLAAAGPYLHTGETGRDLVFVVDRSRSMPAQSDATVLETLKLAEDARREGDRVAVVAFGGNVGIEQLPKTDARFAGFQRVLDRDGSDLGSALDAALALIPSDRNGSLFLISDGENNGRDPLELARSAFARGVRIDVRPVLRGSEPDVAIERIELPEEVGAYEPFQFGAWVRSDTELEAEYVLERDGVELSRGKRAFQPGLNRLLLRDIVANPGVAQYRLRLVGVRDRTSENDVGLGAVRVVGQRPVLVLNDDGRDDTLSLALRKAAIPVQVSAPESARLDRVGLTAFRAVVLENVSAARVGSNGMRGLLEFVLERGGGLLMTGGRASFGIGGWYLSPVDELLPVSMEMRQENRKIGVALVISLDRSGSMGMEAAPGVTKMQLADLGTCAAIELLSPLDSVGVIAVDSTDHTVQELTPVRDVQAITSQVRRIDSGGGGIFCYTALVAAGKMLEDAKQRNRHVILFADAADSEEQEQCPELVQHFQEMGITLSVVALGTETDSDAEFLKRIALIGGGTCYFTSDPHELPRLFAQDTLSIARATFIEEAAATAVLPDLFGLGEVPGGAQSSPRFDGYNLTWLRDDATAGMVTLDEFKSPAFAFAYRGLGRTASFAGQIGGEFGAGVVGWESFASFFVTVVRWLSGQEEPSDLFASAKRNGRDGVISVEIDPRASTRPDLSRANVRVSGPDGSVRVLPLERVAENRFEARTALTRDGVVLGSVDLGDGRMLSLPPLALPYSPEFETSPDTHRGERLLRQIARESGGEVAPPIGQALRGAREAKTWRVVTRELVLAALVLLLIEIAARRLQLWGSVTSLVRSTRTRVAQRVASTKERVERAKPVDVTPRTPGERRTPPSPPPPSPPPPSPPPPSAPAPGGGLDDALAKARRAANRELGR